MKRLILIRHAKSSWSDLGMSDFDRPLNKRGKHDAPQMGQVLLERGICADLIVSSPAKRALKTAKIIAECLDYPKSRIQEEASIYEAHPSKILEIIRGIPESIQTLMVFGHNPGFTMLANYLADREFDNIPTCGIVCLDVGCTKWGDLGDIKAEVMFFEFPKNQ